MIYRFLKIVFALIYLVEAFISIDCHERQLLFSFYLSSRKIILLYNLLPPNFERQIQFVHRITILSSLDRITSKVCNQRGR
jgi:hypothetical protein